MIIGLGAAAVVVGASLVVWSKVGGGTNAIEAVPADAQLVALFDVTDIHKAFTSERVSGFLGEIDPRLAAIDATLAERLGLTFSDDVLPWVGSTAAAWMHTDGDTTGGCLVVSSRDRAAADDFIASVLGLDRTPAATPRQVDGGTVYDMESGDGWSATIGRVEGLVLLCDGDIAANASIAALTSGSLADTEELPVSGDALVTVWLDLPALAASVEAQGGATVGVDPTELAPAIAAFDITDRGFEWSVETLSTFGVEMADDSMASLLPEGTVLTLFGGTPNLDLPAIAGGVPGGEGFGGLLGLLDGPMALGLFGQDDSILAQVFNAPLNIVLGVSSSDPSALAARLRALVADSLGLTEDAFRAESFEGGTLYTLAFPFFGDLAAMAVTDGHISISATADAAKGEGPRLVDSPSWAEATAALKPGTTVGFFFDAGAFRALDLTALLEQAEASADGRLPSDAPSIGDVLGADGVRLAVAGAGTDGERTTVQFLVIMDW